MLAAIFCVVALLEVSLGSTKWGTTFIILAVQQHIGWHMGDKKDES